MSRLTSVANASELATRQSRLMARMPSCHPPRPHSPRVTCREQCALFRQYGVLHVPPQPYHGVVFAGIEMLGEGFPDLITTSGVQRDECENSPPFSTRRQSIHFLNAPMTGDRSCLLVRRAIRCLP